MTRRSILRGLALLAAVATGMEFRRRSFRIAELSMSPVLQPGDYVLTVPATRRLRRGEVLVLQHPLRPGLHLVKRVVGLPGETVEVGEEGVSVEGILLVEPWAHGRHRTTGSWRLGTEEIFVLGDQRPWSIDDGPIPIGAVVGRVVLRTWPPHRVGILA